MFGHFNQEIGRNLRSFCDRKSLIYSHFERCCLLLHAGNTVVIEELLMYLNTNDGICWQKNKQSGNTCAHTLGT